ncbi:TSCPD domain protein [Oxobacter pfennigii]|uniref:ribonucleoside-diphosphate reductase n=1 Tax=Oxobacter pfennigii TaxID=36849 RepID=A0A0P8W823_9CLOT|nr:TIGR03905 family TSCPD domain-containing protein [Oxobacter pfennigii]KPU44829.1 TSCPD domain protein [Oxobacter pfennigii]
MKLEYKMQGVCAEKIDIDVSDGIVRRVEFKSGCDGNLQGISKLIEGMKVEDVIEKLKGIKCGRKSTSCPDQLSKALQNMLK